MHSPDGEAPSWRAVRRWPRWRLVTVAVVLIVVVPGGRGSAVDSQVRPRFEQPSVVVLGDSVTEQAFGYLGGPTGAAPPRLRRWSGVGWTLADAVAAAGVAPLASNGTDVVVIALGPNDAAAPDDGWNARDVTRWRGLLATVAPATCVVVVLPGWGPTIDDTTWCDSMLAMRRDVRRLIAERARTGSPTIEVDWLRVVIAHPEYLAPDGIHLASRTAAEARQTLYWQAIDASAQRSNSST
jgi:hypothetical protein